MLATTSSRLARHAAVGQTLLALMLCAVTISTSTAADSPSSNEQAADAAEATKPNPRPDWVDEPDGLRADGVYQLKVLVGPEPTREACERRVDEAVRTAVHAYIAKLSGPGPDGRPVPLEIFDLDAADYARVAKGDRWEERVKLDGPEVVFLHTRLSIDPQLQNEWKARAQTYFARGRSETLSRWFLSAMWCVAVAHVALRVTPPATTAVRNRRLTWVIAVALCVLPFVV